MKDREPQTPEDYIKEQINSDLSSIRKSLMDIQPFIQKLATAHTDNMRESFGGDLATLAKGSHAIAEQLSHCYLGLMILQLTFAEREE